MAGLSLSSSSPHRGSSSGPHEQSGSRRSGGDGSDGPASSGALEHHSRPSSPTQLSEKASFVLVSPVRTGSNETKDKSKNKDDACAETKTEAQHGGMDKLSGQGNSAPADALKNRSRVISLPEAGERIQHDMKDIHIRLAQTVLSSNSASSVLASRAALIRSPHVFNVRIPKEISPVTSQKSSGRCWLFATTNLLRIPLAQRYNLDNIQLSQSYLFYWDKLEKANYFLELAIETANLPLSDRFVQTVFESPVPDAGQWDMAVNLVKKYGVVPERLYPDPYGATSTGELVKHLSTKLRREAIKLRQIANGGKKGEKGESTGDDNDDKAAKLTAAKEETIKAVQRMITIVLGPPPLPNEEFTWEFYDKDRKFVSVTNTPLELAAKLTEEAAEKPAESLEDGAGNSASTASAPSSPSFIPVHRMFSLSNDPRNEYNTLLTIDRLNNMVPYESSLPVHPIRYVNVPMSVLKSACVRMLRAGLPIFFGCDSGKFSNSKAGAGVWDLDNYDYGTLFGVEFGMKKAERLESGESMMTHAMVITGVHVEGGDEHGKDEKTVRWRIENSWSDSLGEKGYFLMSDAWMDEFVYQVVVDPRFVDKEVRKVLDQEPVVLPRWDPMGALA